ncbi:MAG: hypothetical protein QXH03_07835 [Candidatus Bathyarchaeia archaeon]
MSDNIHERIEKFYNEYAKLYSKIRTCFEEDEDEEKLACLLKLTSNPSVFLEALIDYIVENFCFED